MNHQNPDLNDIAVFVRVADLGSFTAAARSLGLRPSRAPSPGSSARSGLSSSSAPRDG
jgi:hypothetical protein